MRPLERARYRKALAAALGEGRRVTREQILAELGATNTPVTPGPGTPTAVQSAPPAPVPALAVAFLAPDVVTPDAGTVTPPDMVVSFATAAARLGVSESSARRYAAPSLGKLRRVGVGVSLASVVELANRKAA